MESSAEWGGHPELIALARALRVPIRVHAVDAAQPLLFEPEEAAETMGKAEKPLEKPLELTYHRHFYALGEHYNSTLPL